MAVKWPDFLALDDEGQQNEAGAGAGLSRSFAVEVQNLTLADLSENQKAALATRFASDLASACSQDISINCSGLPQTAISLAEGKSSSGENATVVSTELHLPANATEAARNWTPDARDLQGRFAQSVAAVLGQATSDNSSHVQVGNVAVSMPTQAPKVAARLPAVAAPSPSPVVAVTDASGTDEWEKEERPAMHAGLLASFLVGMGSVCLCCGGLLVCLTRAEKTKRSGAKLLGLCNGDDGSSDLEDSEAQHGSESPEAAPLLGPVEKPSPPQSPKTPRTREVGPLQPPAPTHKGHEMHAGGLEPPSGHMRVGGLEPPSGLAIQMGGMGVELPPIGSAPTTMLHTVTSFMQPVAGLSRASFGSQSPSTALSTGASFHGLQPGRSFAASHASFDGVGPGLPERQSYGAIAGPPSPLAPMQARVASPVNRQAVKTGAEQRAASPVEASRRGVAVDVEVAARLQALHLQPQPTAAAAGEAAQASAVRQVEEDSQVLQARRSVEAAEALQMQLQQRVQAAPRRTPSVEVPRRTPSVESTDSGRAGAAKKRVVKYQLKSLSATSPERAQQPSGPRRSTSPRRGGEQP